MKFKSGDGGLQLTVQDFEDEDKEKLLKCLSSIYKVSINDSIYQDTKYFYFTHPAKGQKGLITMLSTVNLNKGENILRIKKISTDEEGIQEDIDYANVPFWIQ